MAAKNIIRFGEDLDPANYKSALTGGLACFFGQVAGTRMTAPFDDATCGAKGGTLIAQQRKDNTWDMIVSTRKDGETKMTIRVSGLTTEQATKQVNSLCFRSKKDGFGCG